VNILKLDSVRPTNIGLARLKTLLAFIRKVPDEQLNLSSWVADQSDLDAFTIMRNGPQLIDNQPVKAVCGTVACAVGWACAMPEFNKAGMFFNPNNGGPNYTTGDGEAWYSWEAVSNFFGISFLQALMLFYSTDDNLESNMGSWDEERERYVLEGRHGSDELEQWDPQAAQTFLDGDEASSRNLTHHQLAIQRLSRFIGLFDDVRSTRIISSED
jgi:hypothetical protein